MRRKDAFREFDSELWLQGDEDAGAQATFIQKVLGLRKGRTVLDAPCGDGRIAVPLAEAGNKGAAEARRKKGEPG